MNLFVLWDNSSRSASKQISPTCAQRFSIKRGGLLVICTHSSCDLFLSTCLWVLVGGEILRDNTALIEKALRYHRRCPRRLYAVMEDNPYLSHKEALMLSYGEALT